MLIEKCKGESFVFRKGIKSVPYLLIVIFFLLLIPYGLLSVPIAYVSQRIFPGILKTDTRWECEIIFGFLVLVYMVGFAIVDGLLLDKAIIRFIYSYYALFITAE